MTAAQEAQAISVEAYIYLYPLVTMDVTRRQATNVPPGRIPGLGPHNMFHNFNEFPRPDFTTVVRPNFDTLYSCAFLDLRKGPVIVSAPDTGGRYYMLPMLDMWTDVFASPGSRTTGTVAADFLVSPPGWTGAVPTGMSRISAPTPYVWVIGRTKTEGPKDYDAVHRIQAGYKATPLSAWGRPAKAVEEKIDPSVDMKMPPKVQVETMPAGKYFAYAAELMRVNPPHITDEPIIARMKRIGIEPGRRFDMQEVDPAVRDALARASAGAQKLMAAKLPTLARVVNGWQMNTDTLGVYGNYYLKRAIIAQVGLGANVPEDALYPFNLGDQDGKPLDGSNRYALHFGKGDTPPAEAFWSVTLYDPDGFPVANPQGRFSVSSWMNLRENADGSLDLYIQHASPGKDKEANWLPAPKGPFNLTMRVYEPRSEALTGDWSPPPVNRV